MDFFKTPGGSLLGRDKEQFDNIKAVIDRCTNDILLRPDWDASLECVELVNAVYKSDVLQEVVFYLKRKLGSKSARAVSLTLALVEALVKNGTMRVHAAIGTDFFMKEMAKTARKYQQKSGSENRHVAEQCLDIIQAWGEAFLPRRNQYPAFVNHYFDLRREGLPFNPQFDASRCPIFTPGAETDTGRMGGENTQEDEILAAALAASLATEAGDHNVPPPLAMSSGANQQGWESAGPEFQSGGGSGAPGSLEKEYPNATSAASSITLLCDMIVHSTSLSELKSNEMAFEILQHLKQLLPEIVNAIEHAVVHNPQCIEGLFKVNEDGNQCVSAYEGMIKGDMSMGVAKEKMKQIQAENGTLNQPGIPAAPAPAAQPSAAPAGGSLLDFEEFSTNPVTTQPIAAAVSSPEKDRALSFEHSMYDRSSQRATAVPTGFTQVESANPLSRRSSVDKTPGSRRTSTSNSPPKDPFAAGHDPFGPSVGIDAILSSPSKSGSMAEKPKDSSGILDMFDSVAAPTQAAAPTSTRDPFASTPAPILTPNAPQSAPSAYPMMGASYPMQQQQSFTPSYQSTTTIPYNMGAPAGPGMGMGYPAPPGPNTAAAPGQQPFNIPYGGAPPAAVPPPVPAAAAKPADASNPFDIY